MLKKECIFISLFVLKVFCADQANTSSACRSDRSVHEELQADFERYFQGSADRIVESNDHQYLIIASKLLINIPDGDKDVSFKESCVSDLEQALSRGIKWWDLWSVRERIIGLNIERDYFKKLYAGLFLWSRTAATKFWHLADQGVRNEISRSLHAFIGAEPFYPMAFALQHAPELVRERLFFEKNNKLRDEQKRFLSVATYDISNRLNHWRMLSISAEKILNQAVQEALKIEQRYE